MRRLDCKPAASSEVYGDFHAVLGAWTTRSTTRTAVDAVACDRVVAERDDDTASADGDTVTDVTVDLVSIDLDASCADVTGVAGADATATVVGDLVAPRENTDRISGSRITEDTVRGVVGEHAITRSHERAGAGVKTVRAAAQSHVVQSHSYVVCGATGDGVDCVKRVVTDDRVPHIQRKIVGFIDRDSVTSIEPEDDAVLHVNGLGLEDVYSVYAITESVNGYTANRDYVSRGCVDDDTIDEGGKDRSKRAGAIESDRLGDRDRTETTWIECINFTAGRGLGDGASPGFAGGSTATGIRIVPNAGHPCSGGLGLGDRDCSKHKSRDCQNLDREPKLTHC